jgi:heptosyltransferase-2
MNDLPIIVHMCVFNEAAFLEPCVRSIIDHVTKIVVIEGTWGTGEKTCGLKRSDDGTCEILAKLSEEFGDKFDVYNLNEPTQLQQRSSHFSFVREPHWLWIVDGDEIYEPGEIEKVKAAAKDGQCDVYDATSMTFVNDAYHYVNIDFPRLFKIEKPGYAFTDPNTLRHPNDRELRRFQGPIASFFHYSYLERSPGRMRQKIRDRIATHGEFKWSLDGERIQRDGISYRRCDRIPEIVCNHPLLQRRASEDDFRFRERERIGFLVNSGMGNLILTTPMLRALREIKPDARISVLTWERGSDILQGWPVVDEIVTQHHGHFVQSIGGLDHLLVSPVSCLKYPGVLEGSRHVVMPQKRGKVWGKHESEYNMDLIRDAFNYSGDVPSCECFLTQENITTAENHAGEPGSYIVVAAGYLHEDHWVLKHWGNKNYAELLPLLKQFGHIVFVGDQNDYEDAEEIIGLADMDSDRPTNLCGQLSIKDTGGVLHGARAIVGNDSGLLHVAACFGTPTVAVWTFTNPIKNLPKNPRLKLAMLRCPHRSQCQHGLYKQCEEKACRSVPVDMVGAVFLKLIEENLHE